MNYEKIGSNIKTAMLNKNVTNEKLAKKMDIPEKRLEDILEGREHPSLDTLILISMLLNVNINGLLDMDVSQTYLKTKLKQSIKDENKVWTMNLIGSVIICIILCIIATMFMMSTLSNKFLIMIFTVIALILVIMDIYRTLMRK
ncbi:MAG: helix-turn-helix transcriptional regulator [Bacilli bacterium]|nr:helix-turn-helix transcriptional regulator [Bacilli bacterium]